MWFRYGAIESATPHWKTLSATCRRNLDALVQFTHLYVRLSSTFRVTGTEKFHCARTSSESKWYKIFSRKSSRVIGPFCNSIMLDVWLLTVVASALRFVEGVMMFPA